MEKCKLCASDLGTNFFCGDCRREHELNKIKNDPELLKELKRKHALRPYICVFCEGSVEGGECTVCLCREFK